MKKTILQHAGATALAMSLALSLAGCGAESANQPGGGKTVELTADLTPAAHPEAEPLTAEQAAQLTDFGLRLAWNGMHGASNGLVSPMSVATALGMAANGARGETLAELETVLGMEQGELNEALYAYWRNLPEGDRVKLLPTNSIWLTNHAWFTAGEDFLQTCTDYYGAELFETPMDRSTCREINRWVEEHTDGMIPEMLNEISPEAVMYLVNALAFDGEWKVPYEKYQVHDGVFLANGIQPVWTELMESTESLYLENDLATGVMKPYQDGTFAFVGLLPKEGSLMKLLDELDGESLQALLRNPQSVPVQTLIPKFETEDQLELQAVLKDMGISRAFDQERADFAALGHSDAGNIYISHVLHATQLILEEQGTRAAAATGIAMNESCAAPDPEHKEVFLDRPFVYLLIDTETCVPFFIGTMQDPTGKAPEPLAGGEPLEVFLNGNLYQWTGEHAEDRVFCGTMDGEITSSVESGTQPTREGQSNFGKGWGYQQEEDDVLVNLGRHWLLFRPAK